MADSLSLSQFAETSTDFARDNKEHLYTELMAPGLNGIEGSPIRPLSEFVTEIPSKDEIVLTELTIGDPLQPDLRGGFTKKDNVVGIKPRTSKVEACKINLLFTEKQLALLNKTYQAQIKGPQSKMILDRFPVFEALINSKIIEKAKSQLRNVTLWNGVKNPADKSASGLFNGLRKIIDDMTISGEIPAGNFTEINPITASNAVTEVKKIVSNLPSEVIYDPEIICIVSPSIMEAYDSHYQTSRGAIPYNIGFNQRTIEGTMIPFYVEPGLTDIETPTFTRKGNIIWQYDDDFESLDLTFDYNVRDEDLAYILKFQLSTNIAFGKEVWQGVTD